MQLEGKVAFITGGGGGIGGGIAQALVERGMKVLVADIDLARAQDQAQSLGSHAVALQLDVTSLVSWTQAREMAYRHFRVVDVLCNNAGIAPPPMPLREMSADAFSQVLAVNVIGIYNGILTFANEMCARRSGHVVNTSSVNGLIATQSMAAYTASKFAVTGMSEALREELAPFNVGVSILLPGLTRSRMSESMAARVKQISREAIEANMMEPIWLGRAVANAITNNEPYIISHPSHRPILEQRYQQILDAFKEPAQPGYTGGTPATK